MITNDDIKQFLSVIDLKDVYYATNADKSLLRLYSACDDWHLQENLIDKMWNYINSKLPSISNDFSGTPIKVLHTNGGQGKVIEKCPDNSIITSYHTDYICKQISDLLNQHRTEGTLISYKSMVFDISYFFINGNNGNTPKYDVVVNQVVKGHSTNYNQALEFLVKGGYLCVYCGNKHLNKISTDKALLEKCKVVKSLKTNSLLSYNCLILQKK